MFRRRKLQPVHHRVGNLIWPSMGWVRATRYFMHRVLRLHGTPYSIAAGIACGSAISFTPLMGGHFVLAATMAWLMGGNMVAALLGTAVGNPWTFPFIWLWIYKLGIWLGTGSGAGGIEPDFAMVFADLMEALLRFDFGHDFAHKFWAVWWPMMVGSLPTGLGAWMITYLMFRPMVSAYQHRRIMRRRRRRDLEAAGLDDGQAELAPEAQRVEEEAKP